LYLYQSNKLEHLCAALCRLLQEPLDDPFTPEIIVAQNPGMARWLAQQIALHNTISANLHFPLPASFIWNIFQQTLGNLPDLSPFERKILLWRILSALDVLLDAPALSDISAYLKGDTACDLKKFQLAEKITDLFDQYLVYRPKMLLDWQEGKENHWQALLWQQLTATGLPHRAALLQQFCRAAEAGKLRTDTLPRRVFLFGINSLAPAYLEVLDKIKDLVEIHIFHLSPCREAWDDSIPQKELARKRQSWREQGLDDLSEYFHVGNPLLASMGGLGRELFTQLVGLQPREVDLYEPPPGSSLLHGIQSDILDLADRGTAASSPPEPKDNSIHFHCCHSPMREVQVLHDRLLDLFAADPGLKPSDILVMAPDIKRYAPYINGVFASAAPKAHIPWSIADQAPRAGRALIEAFLGLLELTTGRYSAPEVLALLENPTIARRFNLSQNALATLRSTIHAAGVRWGLDQEQRNQPGLDSSELYTWAFGIKRLLLGYISGPLEKPFQDIMPHYATGDASEEWLGGLAQFIEELQQLRKQLLKDASPEEWGQTLLGMLDTFLDDSGSRAEQEAGQRLRQAIKGFTESCHQADYDQKIGHSVLLRHLKKQLDEPAGTQAFLSARVTFCNMVPMRSVPFQVIWILGMNDQDFPRSQRPPDFDLIARSPHIGDRSRRDDDRYLFLEALLSCRSHFAISWLGRDQQDNGERPPSVVVAELRDYIDRGWPSTSASRASSELLTSQHPLQPFSRECFSGNPATAGHAEVWFPGPAQKDPKPFISHPLPERIADAGEIELHDLARFWSHPVRFFLQQRLGLRLDQQEEELPESEAFTLDHLQRYQLGETLLTTLLARQDPLPVLSRLQAAANIPNGAFGHLLYQETERTAQEIVRQLRPLTQTAAVEREIQSTIADFQLSGWLNALYPKGRICCRCAKFTPVDLIRLWIYHLFLCLSRPPGIQPVSFHFASDRVVCLRTVEHPEEELLPLLQAYRLGQREPLHFYPKASNALARARNTSAGRAAARRVWYSGYYPGEEEHPAYGIALQGQEPLDSRFEELATLLTPIFAHQEEFHAAP